MARPRTLGPPITFRLPLDAHNTITERAEAHGETIHDYVRRLVTEAATRHRDRYGQITEATGTTIRGQVEPRWKKPKARP